MLSAFDVYLVMQLDSISSLLLAFAIAITVGMAVPAIGCMANRDIYEPGHPRYDQSVQTHKWLAKWIWVPALLFLTFAVVPSTKTAAAMIVLPAITSDKAIDAIAPEVKELLGLTKEALRSMATPKKETKPDATDVEG